MKKKSRKSDVTGSASGAKQGGRILRRDAGKGIRILMLEDNRADAELIENELQNAGILFSAQHVETRNDFLKALKIFKPDLILADFSQPQFDALQALELRKIEAPLTPFIIVTGSISEETAVECMKQGADDYLLKDRLARLGEAIRLALASRRLLAEKIAAEESLRISESMYRTFIDSSTDMAFLKDDRFRHLLANQALCRFYGKEEIEIIGRTDPELMDKRAAARCRKTDKEALAENRLHFSEETIGSRTFETRKFPVKLSNGRIGVGGYIRDISERKQAVEKIRQEQDLYMDLVNTIPSGMYRLRVKPAAKWDEKNWRSQMGSLYSVDFASNRFCEITGICRQEFAANPGIVPDRIHPDEKSGFVQRNSEAVNSLSTFSWEGRMIVPQRGAIWVRFESIPRKLANGEVLWTGVINDITERRKTEEALLEMNEIFRLFLKHNPIYVFIKDENIRPVYLSENYEILLGRPLPEIMGKSMDELFPSELSRAMIEDDKRILHEQKTLEFIEELNGRIYSTIKFPIIIGGKAKYLAGYTTDITERKQIENALRESEERFRAQYHGSPIAAFTWQKKGESFVLKDYNGNAERITNDQFRKFIGKTAGEMYGSRPEIIQAFHQCFLKKSVVSLEALSEHFFSGRQINLTFAFIPPDLVMVHLEDITERKHAEEQIRASLREKEVLLKEIHHRVKNNLQVISGLLTLQAAQTNDERLQRMVKESQGRIWTMAQIHQTLYQSGNLVDIDMADYIRSLAGNLLSSHAQVAMPPTVSFDLIPLRLAIDKAIPLALIINELVTNAMKHAFTDGRPGEIRISLHECRGTARRALDEETDVQHEMGTARCAPTYELTITDNGAGLPAGFDPENQKSLGLQLVTMLSKQLGGVVAIKSSGGTSIHIVFTDNEKKE